MIDIMELVLYEIVLILMLVAIFIIVLIWILLREIILVPTISVDTDRDQYFRGETVGISGNLAINGTPRPNETVALAIQPPSGDAYSLPNVTTDSNGAFSSSWNVPSDAIGGSYVLTATALGISGTKTFTRRRK